MKLAYLPTLGWYQKGQWGGIYGSPMECLGYIYIYTKTESAVGDRLGTSQDSTKCGALKARLWAQELIKTQVKHARHTDSL